jgi:hypothetical protein
MPRADSITGFSFLLKVVQRSGVGNSQIKRLRPVEIASRRGGDLPESGRTAVWMRFGEACPERWRHA